MKIQLQVIIPCGRAHYVDIKPVYDYVLQAGKSKKIVAFAFETFFRDNQYLVDLTNYTGIYETIYYHFVEGCSAEGEIESPDDEILCTWKFLVDYKPVNFEQLKNALEFCIGITEKRQIETYESKNVLWYCINNDMSYHKATRSFCADGDGIVTLEEIDGFFNLVDQGTHIKKLGRDLSVSLQVAENYLHANYRTIFDDCLK